MPKYARGLYAGTKRNTERIAFSREHVPHVLANLHATKAAAHGPSPISSIPGVVRERIVDRIIPVPGPTEYKYKNVPVPTPVPGPERIVYKDRPVPVPRPSRLQPTSHISLGNMTELIPTSKYGVIPPWSTPVPIIKPMPSLAPIIEPMPSPVPIVEHLPSIEPNVEYIPATERSVLRNFAQIGGIPTALGALGAYQLYNMFKPPGQSAQSGSPKKPYIMKHPELAELLLPGEDPMRRDFIHEATVRWGEADDLLAQIRTTPINTPKFNELRESLKEFGINIPPKMTPKEFFKINTDWGWYLKALNQGDESTIKSMKGRREKEFAEWKQKHGLGLHTRKYSKMIYRRNY